MPSDAFCSECGHQQSKSASPKDIPAPLPPRPSPPPPTDWPTPGTPPPTLGTRPPAPTNCPACGQATGGDVSCQFCGQVLILPAGVLLSSAGLRFGGYVLEAVLFVCTLILGWFIWAFIVFARGQTPAKQVLNMRVISIQQGRAAGWWRMFFREFIAKMLIIFVAAFTFLIPYFWLLWDRNRQELWDKMGNTLVVSDPADQLRPASPDSQEGP
ncbi:RDD family protein (plasmid) [Streptomyces sp. NBC_01724]|uniref:RDD family protein n=1 Tax=Streptomyces sp. NBC_01724 TaxID=2975922 RepID=UPI002E33932D|nr:RDD family protein [Streptomyces sp. NBC_01724]